MKNQCKTVMALMLSAGVANAAYVTIGGAGNSNDGSGARNYGGVSYTYKISSTEVSIAEFQASGAGDGNEDMWNSGEHSVGTNAPASNVSLYEAMKYCNYLTSGNVNSGYYSTSDGGLTYQANTLSHIAYATANGSTYFVPTEDEWYKAAYYSVSGDNYSRYADGTGTTPTEGGGETGWHYNGVFSGANFPRDVAYGSPEQNGTVNMMGNVEEWVEDSDGILRGGYYYSPVDGLRSWSRTDWLGPSVETGAMGFRPVEVVPEPATAGLLAISGLLIAGYRRIRKSYGC